ncbi:MAG TPA: quinol dehydrogenase ferredoxin subunit NapH, partial [Usitatibacteraceae bacterium]|nr:quinol dehydrogenase ferredoxin subunit NapH [Usitatibacteraceae bacterium]
RPVRHFEMPSSLAGKVHAWRFLIARRAVQAAVLLAFFGTAHWGWKAMGRPFLAGNLSAASLAGKIPLADPFAVLEVLATRHLVVSEALLGAAIVFVIYFLLGGRVFCAWVCPMNVVTDAARWVRRRLAVRDVFAIPPGVRYAVLALALVLSAIAGVAAFDWISPIAMLHREILYGAGLGLTSALGVFLFDAFVLKHGWCGHLCPLGAFWSLAGRGAQVRVAFDDATCTRCGDCLKVCPEPRVLNFNEAARAGMVRHGECTNCAACIAVCPESSLRFTLRAAVRAYPVHVPGTKPFPTEGMTP